MTDTAFHFRTQDQVRLRFSVGGSVPKKPETAAPSTITLTQALRSTIGRAEQEES